MNNFLEEMNSRKQGNRKRLEEILHFVCERMNCENCPYAVCNTSKCNDYRAMNNREIVARIQDIVDEMRYDL